MEGLVKDGYAPVVFCRYVATAHYVAAELKKHFPKVLVDVVTGELSPEERRAKVEGMEEGEGTQARILVATDCLSGGINLQHLFTAVVHYDLAWNPTRHEQREGRVDRFGQQAPEVRCTMLYGQDNPVDGFVLNRHPAQRRRPFKKSWACSCPCLKTNNASTRPSSRQR